MHANWPHKINDQINRKRQGLPDAGCQRGATAILLFVCMLSLFSTNCPNIIVLHSANTSELQATKKPHNYHKIAVWQKDDRIRKSPLNFAFIIITNLKETVKQQSLRNYAAKNEFLNSTAQWGDGIHSRTVDIYSFIQSCYGYDSF